MVFAMNERRWEEVKSRRRDSLFVGVPVQIKTRWQTHFMWCLDSQDQPLLVFSARDSTDISFAELPKLNGIKCFYGEAQGKISLCFLLLDHGLLDIYNQFIDFLVISADVEENEASVFSTLIRKAWRWHYLLKSGSLGYLSKEEQKGLLAETYVLAKFLLPSIGAASSLMGWTGPKGAPKDFEISDYCIEVKARRSGSVDAIQISSSDQLATTATENLYLVVIDLHEVDANTKNATTLLDWIREIRETIANDNMASVSIFDDLLAQVGFEFIDHYRELHFSFDNTRVFEVKDDFPRILPNSCSASIDNVKYRIRLGGLERFLVTMDHFGKLLRS